MRHLLALLLVAVAAPQSSAAAQPLPDWADDDGRYDTAHSSDRIRAAVWFDEYTGVASFDLNRPGHVAVFAIQPLGRIEMIYPVRGGSFRSERAFRSGRHSVRTESRFYHLARSGSRGMANRRAAGQTYIVLIASDRPLWLDPLRASRTIPSLNRASVTWNPFIAAEHLAREIVPSQRAADWTVAYHVVWPEASFRRYDGRVPVTTVRCPGDVVIAVPTQAIRTGIWNCPRPARRPGDIARPRSPLSPPIREALPQRPRSRPTAKPAPRGRAVVDGRAVPRATPPKTRPSPGARATSQGKAVPRATPPKVRPATRPKPSSRVKPPSKKRPIPKAKPKKGGNGG